MNQEILGRLDLAEQLGCKAAIEMKSVLTLPEIPLDVNKVEEICLGLTNSMLSGADIYEQLDNSLDVLEDVKLERLPARSLDLLVQTIFQLDNFAEESDDFINLAADYELSFLLTDLLLSPQLSEETLSLALIQDSDLGMHITGFDGVPFHYLAIATSPRFSSATLDEVFADTYTVEAVCVELLQNPMTSSELIEKMSDYALASSLFLEDPDERWRTALGIQKVIKDKFPGVSQDILNLAKPFDWTNENLEIFKAIIDWRLDAAVQRIHFPYLMQLPKFWRN